MSNIWYASFVAERFKSTGMPPISPLLHAAIGISGEAGELLDAVKKHMIYGKELDKSNVIEELGDLLFYIQAAINSLPGVTFTEIIDRNMEKLMKRYPDGYSDENAIARADKAEEE